MVKPPKIRHSKTRQEPVTIELEPDAVSRLADEKPAKTEAEQQETPTEQVATETDAPETAAASEKEAAPVEQDGEGARETEPSRDFSDPGPAEPQTPAPRQRGGMGGLGAGLLGGLIALAGAGGLTYAGLLPLPSKNANTSEISSLRSEIGTLRDQVTAVRESGQGASGDSIKRALDEATSRIDGLATTLEQAKADVEKLKAAVESGGAGENAGLQSLSDKVAGLEKSVAALGQSSPGTSASELAALDGRIASVETAIQSAAAASTANDSRLAAIQKDVDALKTSVDGIAGKVEAQAGQPKAALVIAAAGLKAAVEAGGPFEPEVEAFASVAPNAPGLAELRTLAGQGVPSRDAIIAAAPEALDAMVTAAHATPADAGIVDRLLDSAASLVKVRPVGPVDGTGAPETVARIEAALKSGDFAKAVAEYETLPQASRDAGKGLMDMVRARLDAERLVDKATAGALKA